MQTEITKQYKKAPQSNVRIKDVSSVCKTPKEQQRLYKLFEIFIKVDKQLKIKSCEGN